MKIVYITRKFLEGFAYQDNELAEIHSVEGHQVTVITSKTDDDSLYFDRSLTSTNTSTRQYNIIALPLKYRAPHQLWQYNGLVETLEKIKPDIIFLHGSPRLCLLDLVKYKKRHTKVILAMDCHDDHYNSAHGFISTVLLHKFIYRSVIRYADKYIDIYYYLSPNIKKFMKEMYCISDKKMEYLPRGGRLEKMNIVNRQTIRLSVRQELGISDTDIIVVTGGKLDLLKMTHNICSAINSIDNPNIHLIVFGSIENSYKEILMAAAAENPNIHFTGWVTPEQTYDYFLASDMACFPGRHSVLWEQAICCGVPLIIKNWYDGMYYLNVKDNAILLPDSDVNYIKEAISQLANNPQQRSMMQKNALDFGREFFSYDRIANMITDFVISKNLND